MADKPNPFAACSILLAMASAAAGQPRAEFIELPASFRAEAISGDGRTVVGFDSVVVGAAYWTREGGVLGLSDGWNAFNVNHDGSVIVGSGGMGACRWVNGGPMEPLGTLTPGESERARAVSADGTVIVGTSGRLAFRWTPQRGIEALTPGPGWNEWAPTDVSADGLTSVGVGYDTLGQRNGAIQWPRTGGMRLLFGLGGQGKDDGRALAVSQDGSMTVGYELKPDGQFRTVRFAAVWPEDGGPPRDLGAGNPAIFSSHGFDVTDTGEMVIATARTRDRDLIGTAYTAQTGFIMLQERLEAAFGLGQGALDRWGILKISGNSEALLLQRGTSNAYAVVYWPGYCITDCELDGALDVFDYLCFLNKWTANDPYACDFDEATGPGICDTFDFVEFGTLFARGFCR